MRHDFIDRFSRLDSPIHRLPASVKLAASLAIVVATVTIHFSHASFFIALGGSLVLILAFSAISWKFAFGRLLMLEPFALGVAVLALLQPGGWQVFLSILVRSTLCLFTMILLSNTTPFAEILRTFQRIGVPRLLVTVLALMYRYLFVLIDETERLNRARASRTFSSRRRSQWQMMSMLISQLFVRSTERAERIFAAMSARGWK